jgi:hypothetical protein
MITVKTIKIPKVEGNLNTWFKLTGGTAYKNVGALAEVGYSTVISGTPPSEFKGEPVLQGETVDNTRGDIYVLQDAYYSYEFIPVA